jgi:hypothetical protein
MTTSTPTLADAQAKRHEADRTYVAAREAVNAGHTKQAESLVLRASDLEHEADRLELLAWRALLPLLDSEHGGYQCPNGHAFARVHEVKCDQCEASVACVPAAALIAYAEPDPELVEAVESGDLDPDLT